MGEGTYLRTRLAPLVDINIGNHDDRLQLGVNLGTVFLTEQRDSYDYKVVGRYTHALTAGVDCTMDVTGDEVDPEWSVSTKYHGTIPMTAFMSLILGGGPKFNVSRLAQDEGTVLGNTSISTFVGATVPIPGLVVLKLGVETNIGLTGDVTWGVQLGLLLADI